MKDPVARLVVNGSSAMGVLTATLQRPMSFCSSVRAAAF
jgi:hypothetical protein